MSRGMIFISSRFDNLDRPDEEFVRVNEQVRIGLNNFRIALEKQQPDVIYKLCLAILRQYYFFNAFIATTDAPEIYMQQFWHTITPKDPDHPFITPPPHDDIVSFIKKLGYPEDLEQVSKMVINNMYQPWRTFMSMINRCLTGKASGFDRPRLALLQVL
ncbi:retrovirus-related pol polyprotein from transposon TNT 1-94 [Tanacetum coccineum]